MSAGEQSTGSLFTSASREIEWLERDLRFVRIERERAIEQAKANAETVRLQQQAINADRARLEKTVVQVVLKEGGAAFATLDDILNGDPERFVHHKLCGCGERECTAGTHPTFDGDAA